MASINYFDKATGKWVTSGSSNASGIELNNAGYTDEQGNPVSVNEAFTKVYNKTNTLEQHLAWIYQNGALGGGGGGGGGGGDIVYTIDIAEGNVVYTSTGSFVINITIKSGGVKKPFTVVAKDLTTNQVLGTWKKYSMSRTELQFSGIKSTTDIEISAYDNENIYAEPAYFKVVAGAISLDLQNIPNKTIYIGGTNEVPLNFTVNNHLIGTEAYFIMTMNGLEVGRVTGINTPIRSIYYDARKLIFNNPDITDPKAGQRFLFEAQAFTTLNGELIKSNLIKFDITVADSNRLVIVTDDITDYIPTEDPDTSIGTLTRFSKGSQVAFSYYFSYGPTKYQTFNMDYVLYGVSPVGEVELDRNTVKNIVKGETNRFVYSTVNLDVTQPQSYYKLVMNGYAVNDPGDTTAQYTKYVSFLVTEATQQDIYANNDMHTLLAYFSKISGFPNTSTGTWAYAIPTSGQFIYEGPFASKFPNGVELVAEKVNGKTSGFISDLDGINSVSGIRLQGESYAYLKVAEQMFPDMEISSGMSFFQPAGFCISTTYRADQSSSPDETILSIGRYEGNTLLSGIEITLETITVKIGSADTIVAKVPQDTLLTVDIDVSLHANKRWYFKIYINGVLSKVTCVLEKDIDWTFGEDLYLGCAQAKGVRNRFSNVTFYDIKLYTSSQSELAVVQNFISATLQANLIKGQIDSTLDGDLRSKNLFNSAGECIIWDKTANNGKGDYITGERLYNKLIENMETSTPYPILLIEETSNTHTLFEAYSTAVFAASDKEEIMSKQFPTKFTYTDRNGKAIMNTPAGVPSNLGTRTSIQGTSSLSYNSKNYEMYGGQVDETGTPMLFQPKDDWLPENRYTLKADVMDSAHVNNVIIGKVVNGLVKNEQGVPITPFQSTPPMEVSNSLWDGDVEQANYIKSRIKHSTDGFPVLLFIRFAPDKQGNTKQPKFMGIYNFNLGRHAYYNLGLKLLKNFKKETPDGPTVVKEYTEINNYWNDGKGKGVTSIEINQNSSNQGAFQQHDLQIVKFMADVIYTSTDTDKAYSDIQTFYHQMANMALSKIQRYTMSDDGQTPDKPIPGEFYNLDKNAYYNFAQCDKFLNWNNACAYYIIMLIFGLVDNACKNLTIRGWGGTEKYLSFYDTDSGMALNNAGQDVVEYWAHLHRWYNLPSQGTGTTTFDIEKNYHYPDGSYKQYYASWWNRIWEILENLALIDDGNVGTRTSVESTYVMLRTNMFPDPDEFIDKYYKGYTESTGAIIFNYDYRQKYLQITKTYNPVNDSYTDTTDFSQLKFLHGNRVHHVKDWFRKRILMFDGVYGFSKEGTSIPANIESPLTGMWADNKLTGNTEVSRFTVGMSGSSNVLYRYSFDSTRGAFWINEDKQDAIVPMPFGETILYVYANKYIKSFDNFKSYPWTSLNTVNLPLLEDLDLSGLKNMAAANFFKGGVYDKANDIGLKNIRNLNLSGIKLTGSEASAYTLKVDSCDKLQKLDISNSSITKVNLSPTAVLKEYNLSGTDITELNLSNQSFLETVYIDGCNKLTKITLDNLASLKTISMPSSVETLIVRNCPSLASLSLPYNTSDLNKISPLYKVTIDNCPGLIYLNFTNQNNPRLDLELVGAWNLEQLILYNSNPAILKLPSLMVGNKPNFTSLRYLDISKTNISHFEYNDQTITDYLDLSNFPNLDYIMASECPNLLKVVCCNNAENPIDLPTKAFANNPALKRVVGHYRITGQEVFLGCSELEINPSSIYETYGHLSFINDSNATNISFSDIPSLLNCFGSCALLTYDDFKFIMIRLPQSLTTIEGIFKGCVGISGNVWYDMLRNCPGVTSIKEAFSTTGLSGPFLSRTNSYSYEDDSTWGILDFVPNLLDAEQAFNSTALTAIDNKVFEPRLVNGVLTYSSIVKYDKMFSGCGALETVKDTRAIVLEAGELDSETFFTNMRNSVTLFPVSIFSGAKNVVMRIKNDSENNTLLFHTIKENPRPMVLDNSILNGITLKGTINNNVFGGLSKTIGKYKIPEFTSIQAPFNNTGDLAEFDLGNSGALLSGLSSHLLQAVSVFQGLKLVGTKKIPNNLLIGCAKLNSVEGLFSGLDLDYGQEEFEFPHPDLFKDCVSLQNIRSLISDTNKIKIKLIGDGFKNTALRFVTGAFKDSGIYGNIPYRLFYMERDGQISRTIEDMGMLFNGCYYLGYSKSRQIDFDTVLDPNIGTTTGWHNHILLNEGDKVDFKLDVKNITKITLPDGTKGFDEWYLDGYGYEGAASADSDFAAWKASIDSKYFVSDRKQKKVIEDQLALERYVPTKQNYIIPTDLFRYCNSKCRFAGVLSGIQWKQTILEEDQATGIKTVVETNIREGLFGRIPMKLFESLVDLTVMDSVFKGLYLEAFIGFTGSTFERGLLYPTDLFKYNVNLTELISTFENTHMHVGCDINPELFSSLVELRKAEQVWANCYFDKRAYNAEGTQEIHGQVPFSAIFGNQTRLSSVSGLFAVTGYDVGEAVKGLFIIESSLLNNSKNLNNISNMFLNNSSMVGNVPTFTQAEYQILNVVTGYLSGCPKTNITNADLLEERLKPLEWSQLLTS